MWPQDDERDVLLIDRAAAAHVPQDSDVREWALDKRVFISSVMAELGEERSAVADGVRSLGAKPVMFEEFGGRDADPLDAYLGEVETSQIYVGILGQSYGRFLPTRFSATHTEFRHAEQQGATDGGLGARYAASRGATAVVPRRGTCVSRGPCVPFSGGSQAAG